MSRVELLVESLSSDEILLAKLLKYRSSRARKYILIVEGHDDVTFVDTVLGKHRPDSRLISAIYNCKGKKNELILHRLILEGAELIASDFRVFIDRDFDGMRGYPDSEIIWMTPTYSFENILVSEEVLESILVAEYRCNDADSVADVDALKSLFRDYFIPSYTAALSFPNLCAYVAKLDGVDTNPHEESVTQYIGVSFPEVTYSRTEDETLVAMGKFGPLSRVSLAAHTEQFSALEPMTSWRGKFLFAAFTMFLDEARKDRGKKNPAFFSKKAKMTFNPRTDSVRALTSVANLPTSLVEFVGTLR